MSLLKPLSLSVRGEIFLSRKIFNIINSRLEVPYANPRDPAPLTAIHGIDEKIALTIIHELSRPEVRCRIEGLKEAGLSFSEKAGKVSEGGLFSGQTWCVTGSFIRFNPRESAMEKVKKGGGRVSSNVTSKTTHLLTGTGAGSKLEKAHSLGVRIVSEEEFLQSLYAE